jgi:hypothetical protein
MTSQQQHDWLSESGDGTRPTEAECDCCRTKPHPSKSEQENTSCSDKQSAKAKDCLIVFSAKLLE